MSWGIGLVYITHSKMAVMVVTKLATLHLRHRQQEVVPLGETLAVGILSTILSTTLWTTQTTVVCFVSALIRSKLWWTKQLSTEDLDQMVVPHRHHLLVPLGKLAQEQL